MKSESEHSLEADRSGSFFVRNKHRNKCKEEGKI